MAAPATNRDAVRQVALALIGDGWVTKHVNDGGDTVRVKTFNRAVHAIMASSSAILTVTRGKEHGEVVFVLDGNPKLAVTSHSTNLKALVPLICGWVSET